MKTTVEITDSLIEEAREYAASHGLTLRQVIETGLRDVLKAGETRPKKKFRLRDCSYGKGGMIIEGGWQAIRDEIYKGRGA